MVDLNVLALFKGGERFVFVYTDDSVGLLLDAVRDAAADPDHPINWFDARVLCDRDRVQVTETHPATPSTGGPDAHRER